jgi:hypothetical protein
MGTTLTLDEMHQSILTQYRETDRQIPSLVATYNTCKDSIKNVNNIDEYMDLKDKLRDIHKKIKKHHQNKKTYMLRNVNDIFTYFEEKQKISIGTNVQNTNILNDFFKIKSNDDKFINPNKYVQSKKQLKYWKNINMQDGISLKNFIYTYDVCEHCNNGEMIHQDEEGVLICNNRNCGHFIPYIVDSSKPTNKEPPNEVSYTAYIRLNHFKEILAQFQAKETTYIPPEVLQGIKDRIKKERIDVEKQLTPKMMREILRKLGYNKYFEHIQYINSLIGIQPPLMSEELTETLCVLFIEIQSPWGLYCPMGRVNFFNYSYILYQLCVLLDQTQYLPYITLLKNDGKQKLQDETWKKVCRDLDWKYTGTV